MIKQNTEMVFCKECETLALAKLDSFPYCTQCLLQRIKISNESRLKKRIEPLGECHSAICRDCWPDELPENQTAPDMFYTR